jgi:CheY-like chemotaxis protein
MGKGSGHILVVDDQRTSRRKIALAVKSLGHTFATAENGRQALDMLRAQPFDLVLLDIMMPVMDGYQVLAEMKADPGLRDIPVIVISAAQELDSVVKGIELGAEDYLPKTFDPSLLKARVDACLDKKRYRDRELEYLHQVDRLTDAASAVEAAAFEPGALLDVAERGDELGQLARVFQNMARKVHLREQRLRQQLRQLRLDMDVLRTERTEPICGYLPMDRRQALSRGESLPNRAQGAALFADISGFTPLTEALVRELGPQRGVEELPRHLNRVYGAVIAEIHRYGGSVLGFSGDAVTCWFDDRPATPAAGLRAIACGLAVQRAMAQFEAVTTPAGTAFQLSIKVAAVTGSVRRFLVGDPAIQTIEVIAGQTPALCHRGRVERGRRSSALASPGLRLPA